MRGAPDTEDITVKIAVFSLLALSIVSSAFAANAGANKLKACAAHWNTLGDAQKAAEGTYQKYTADCMSGKVALTPANSSQERMKACAAQWDKLKAEGRTNNQTYQQYSASCLKS
jgi:hypothetical protein